MIEQRKNLSYAQFSLDWLTKCLLCFNKSPFSILVVMLKVHCKLIISTEMLWYTYHHFNLKIHKDNFKNLANKLASLISPSERSCNYNTNNYQPIWFYLNITKWFSSVTDSFYVISLYRSVSIGPR